jgi:hypothetical protein
MRVRRLRLSLGLGLVSLSLARALWPGGGLPGTLFMHALLQPDVDPCYMRHCGSRGESPVRAH